MEELTAGKIFFHGALLEEVDGRKFKIEKKRSVIRD
jgi:hypothetical protein